MKTTLDIQDQLLARDKRHARSTGRPLRAVVEDGLRLVLSASASNELLDCRTGDPNGSDPLERYTWPELRALIYTA